MEKINDIINDFINNINRIVGNGVDSIIIYGSYARGDYSENSDIDIIGLIRFLSIKIF